MKEESGRAWGLWQTAWLLKHLISVNSAALWEPDSRTRISHSHFSVGWVLKTWGCWWVEITTCLYLLLRLWEKVYPCAHRNSNICGKSELSYTLFTSAQLALYTVFILWQKLIITNTHPTEGESNRTPQFERSYSFDSSRVSGWLLLCWESDHHTIRASPVGPKFFTITFSSLKGKNHMFIWREKRACSNTKLFL